MEVFGKLVWDCLADRPFGWSAIGCRGMAMVGRIFSNDHALGEAFNQLVRSCAQLLVLELLFVLSFFFFLSYKQPIY